MLYGLIKVHFCRFCIQTWQLSGTLRQCETID